MKLLSICVRPSKRLTHLLCRRTCLQILAMASLDVVLSKLIEESGSLDKAVDSGSFAFLKNSCDFSENMVSILVAAKTISLTEKVAGFGRSLTRCSKCDFKSAF